MDYGKIASHRGNIPNKYNNQYKNTTVGKVTHTHKKKTGTDEEGSKKHKPFLIHPHNMTPPPFFKARMKFLSLQVSCSSINMTRFSKFCFTNETSKLTEEPEHIQNKKKDKQNVVIKDARRLTKLKELSD